MDPDIRSLLATLIRTERLPTDRLLEYHWALIAEAMKHARSHVAAYAERLDPAFHPDGRFDPSRWSNLPILTKDELRTGGDAFFAHDLPEHLKPLQWSATSGTTAEPLLVAKTTIARLVSVCLNERLRIWHRLDASRSMALLQFSGDGKAEYPDGRTLYGWSLADPRAPHHILSLRATVEQQIDWLRRRRPAYLSAYPSIAAEIAREMGKTARDLHLAAVLTYGEGLSGEQRNLIEKTFRAKVVDAYSANEVGFVAIQCPASTDYHILADTIRVDVVDADFKPVQAGELGDILLTPIYNSVMPLVRYRIGDLGVLVEGSCPCGRTLPRLRRIEGRTRDLFRYADGSARFANLHIGDLQKCVPLKQFQILQHTLTDIELLYVPADGGKAVDQDALTALAKRDLHSSVTVRATAVEDIPRSPAGKFERTRSFVPAP